MIFLADLNIISYAGCIGGEHYYGKIKFPHWTKIEDVEIKKRLSIKEAKYLTKKDECRIGRYKPGDLTDRFESREQLIRYSIRYFKEKYSDCLLTVNQGSSMSARKLIYWPKKLDKLAEKINALAQEWMEIGGYGDYFGKGGNETRASEIDEEYLNLIYPYMYGKERENE